MYNVPELQRVSRHYEFYRVRMMSVCLKKKITWGECRTIEMGKLRQMKGK